MARVTRIRFDVSDIKAVQVHCAECPMTVVLPPKASYDQLPRNCPNYGNQWGNSYPDQRSPEEHLLERLEGFLTAKPPSKRGMTISFEVDSD